VLVIGLGWWFAQQGGNGTQHPAANTEQAAQPRHQTSPAQKDDSAPLPVPASASIATVPGSGTDTAASSRANVTTASLIQTEQAQGYTPLMLCDPLSCSEDAQVVRMELPASAADGSTATQMADVIVGDDGLVRAIRIVQQQ
jgi:hypothetical protein